MGERLRVLVAEDEFIIGHDLCSTVAEAGYIVEGPFSDISSTMLAYQKQKPDLAILDVNLRDGTAYALAQTLAQENVPIIFYSGHVDTDARQANFPNATSVLKPCPPAKMIAAMGDLIAR